MSGDILQRPEGNPNVDFIEQGRLETLRFIAETFDAVKRGRDASRDSRIFLFALAGADIEA
jgi:hypothetical protein